MVTQTNIAEAKAKLSALIEAALNGEEVIIAKAGKPLVKMVPVEAKSPKRLGIMKDLGWREEDTPFEVFTPLAENAVIADVFPNEPDKDDAA